MMEVGESIEGMEVCSGFPRVVADAVALPLDEVVELSTHDPAVENALDFELFVVIDDLGRRGRSRVATRKGIGGRESELYDQEDRVVTAHGEGELELVGSMADAQSDFERPGTSMGQFRRWSGGANIARVQPDLVARLQVRRRFPSTIVIQLVVALSLRECHLRFLETLRNAICEVVDCFGVRVWLGRLEAHPWVLTGV